MIIKCLLFLLFLTPCLSQQVEFTQILTTKENLTVSLTGINNNEQWDVSIDTGSNFKLTRGETKKITLTFRPRLANFSVSGRTTVPLTTKINFRYLLKISVGENFNTYEFRGSEGKIETVLLASVSNLKKITLATQQIIYDQPFDLPAALDAPAHQAEIRARVSTFETTTREGKLIYHLRQIFTPPTKINEKSVPELAFETYKTGRSK